MKLLLLLLLMVSSALAQGPDYFTINPEATCAAYKRVTITYTGKLLPPNGIVSDNDLGDVYMAFSEDFTYEWNWGNGQLMKGSGMGPFEVYWNSTGIKTVTLTITNARRPENKIVINKTVSVQQPELSAEWEDATCTNDHGKITIIGEGGTAPYQYSIDSVHFQADPNFAVLPGDYNLALKDANGCVTLVHPLRIDPPDQVVLNVIHDNPVICQGEKVKLETAGNANTYTWYPAAGLDDASAKEPVVSPLETTTYTVTGSIACSSVEKTVTVHVVPGVTVHVTNPTEVQPGVAFQLNAFSPEMNGVAGATYQWTPELGLSDVALRDPVATIDAETTYSVTVTSPEGCSATANTVLSVKKPLPANTSLILMPTIFTPNGDGKNDLLAPRNQDGIAFRKFTVYSRWGELVFHADHPGFEWDGNYNGEKVPGGSYFYRIEGVTKEGATVSKDGTVLLIR